jgi:hypothetical protein
MFTKTFKKSVGGSSLPPPEPSYFDNISELSNLAMGGGKLTRLGLKKKTFYDLTV